jgi:hypothetical protein
MNVGGDDEQVGSSGSVLIFKYLRSSSRTKYMFHSSSEFDVPIFLFCHFVRCNETLMIAESSNILHLADNPVAVSPRFALRADNRDYNSHCRDTIETILSPIRETAD